MERITELTTQKGKAALGFRGFKYRKDREYPSSKRIAWRCSVTGCKGRLQTSTDLSNPQEVVPHSHFSDPDKLLSDEAIQKMRERARRESIPIPVIYKQECSAITTKLNTANSNEQRPIIPSFYEIRGTLYNARKVNYPPLPTSLESIQIPENLTKTLSGKGFLLHHDKSSGLLNLGTPHNLKILCNSKELYMDGTFDVSPRIFHQLFSIHGFVNEKQLPLIYALLPNKSVTTYKALFRAVRDVPEQRISFSTRLYEIFYLTISS